MAPTPTPDDTQHDAATLAALNAAALQVIAEMPSGELLAAVTPERIGKLAGYSASSVRYQFARAWRATQPASEPGTSTERGWAFDRQYLWLTLVDEIARRVLETAREVAAVYIRAIDEAHRDGDLEPLKAAVLADLDAYAPGASEATTELSERAYLIALGTCEDSPAVARKLREAKAAEVAIYAEVYAYGLPLVGRCPKPGSSYASIAADLCLVYEGTALRRRYDPTLPVDDIVRPLHAMLWGLTEPIADEHSG
jgi:hypothetical protein